MAFPELLRLLAVLLEVLFRRVDVCCMEVAGKMRVVKYCKSVLFMIIFASDNRLMQVAAIH
jgi:hypothetical protein